MTLGLAYRTNIYVVSSLRIESAHHDGVALNVRHARSDTREVGDDAITEYYVIATQVIAIRSVPANESLTGSGTQQFRNHIGHIGAR